MGFVEWARMGGFEGSASRLGRGPYWWYMDASAAITFGIAVLALVV